MIRVTLGALLALGLLTLASPQFLTASGRGLDPSTLPAQLTSPVPSAAPAPVGKTGGAVQRSAAETAALPGKKPTGLRASSVRTKQAELRSQLDVLAAARASGLSQRTNLDMLRSVDAVNQLAALDASAGSSLKISWREETGTLRFLAGHDLGGERAGSTPEVAARKFLDANRALLQLSRPDQEMRVRGTERDRRGFTAVRFDQTLHGIPLWAHDAVVRFDPNGRTIGFSGFTRPTADLQEPSASLRAKPAPQDALRLLRDRAAVDAVLEASELVYYPVDGALRLAWHHTATAGLAWRGDLFVDAATGEYLHHLVNIHTDGPVAGSGADLSNTTRSLGLYQIGADFFMMNTTKAMFDAGKSQFPDAPVGTINILNAQNGDGSQLFHTTSTNANNWSGLKNGVSAAYYASKVYDYFSSQHGRNAIDGKGSAMWVVINFQQNFNNAFWNGQFMVFGNGDGNDFSDLAGALDVTAHEMSHGVVEHTANLVYEFQSGALNEHFADAFGASCEFFVDGGSANWLLGEDVTTPNVANDALRDMETPDGPKVAFNGQQPAHMNAFQVLTADQDNGGVHINSGIPNRAFFLTATAIGIPKAEDMWYRALSQHLVRNSQFVDFRLALIQSAGELFGSTEVAAVTAALDAVGITGDSGTPPPPPPGDNVGNDFIAVVDAEVDGHAYITTPAASDFQDITGLEIGPGGRPSFSDDGTLYAFVAADGNVYLGDYTQTTKLSTSGGWWSVALSADGRYLAATTVSEDGSILVFDLADSQNDQVYDLPSQNSTTGEVADQVVFADVLEFAVAPGILIYDALNRTQLAGGTYEYWEINLLRLTDGEAFRVFPPLPVGESVGNPTFAQNSDNRIAFDYAASDGNIYCVGFDFQSGDQGIITNNLQSISRPTFSGDDSEVFYMFSNESGSVVYRVGLAADGVTGTGNDAIWVTGGHSPVWLTVGQRTPVALLSLTGTWDTQQVTLNWQVEDPGAFVGYLVSRALDDAPEYVSRTESPIPAASGGKASFVETAPSAEVARYRIDGLSRSGGRVELGRLTLRPAGTAPVAATLAAMPNPFRNGARIAYTLPHAAGNLRITVHDITGRLIATLPGGDLRADEGVVEWSGRDDAGTPVPAGQYFVKLSAEGSTATARIVRLP